MGSSTSRIDYSANQVFNVGTENIFASNFDEVAFSEKFDPEILEKDPKDVIIDLELPEDAIISDLMCDPLNYTQASTSSQAWVDVLVPLFNGKPQSKLYYQQLILSYLRFLKDRTSNAFNIEYNRRNRLEERRLEETRSVIRVHSEQGTPLIPNFSEIVTGSWTHTQIINEISKFIVKGSLILPTPHNAYRIGSEIIHQAIESVVSAEVLYNGFLWGYFSGDLSAILLSYIKSISYSMKNESVKMSFPQLSILADSISKIPLNNSLFLPTKNGLEGSISYEFRTSDFPWKQGILSTNGLNLFLLKSETTTEMISLSKNVPPDYNRSKLFNSDMPIESIAYSNGHLLYLFSSSDIPYISAITDFSVDKSSPAIIPSTGMFSSQPKIEAPITSDGYYIYSVGKKSINVFSIQESSLVFHREIELKSGPNQMREIYSTKVPKVSKDRVFYFTNGIVLSIMITDPVPINGQWTIFCRHFSLIDGRHIMDHDIQLDFPLVQLQADPWNMCTWGISPTQEGINLLRFSMHCSQPSWVTGLDISSICSCDTVVSKILKANRMDVLSHSMFAFLGYFTSHCNGSHFRSCSNNNFYDRNFARFFGPTTPLVIDTIMDSIAFFRQLYTSSKFTKIFDSKTVQSALSDLIRLLNYNLSNFETRIDPQASENLINLTTTEDIINTLLSMFTDNTMKFLQIPIAYCFLDSFSVLFKNNLKSTPSVFLALFETFPPDYQQLELFRLSSITLFPYCFNSSSCRKIFSPLFKKMISKSLTSRYTLTTVHIRFIETFLASLMYEMNAIFVKSPLKLSGDGVQLEEVFHTFCGIITENAISALSTNSFREPFDRIFKKWMMLLKPFTSYSRIAPLMVSLLQPLYNTISSVVSNKQDAGPANKEDFYQKWSMFLELFGLYSDFSSALLEGGSELNDSKEYMWLLYSTIASKLNPKTIDDLSKSIFKENSTKSGLLKRGLSFQVIDSVPKQASEAENLISFLVIEKETSDAKLLMDYLYKKVNNPLNKRLTDEDRHSERVVFAVFIKQLGVTGIAVELWKQLTDKKEPNLNHMIKQIVDAIYRIRRSLKAISQQSQTLKLQCEQNMVPFSPTKLEEDYDGYKRVYLKKCVFLLHIDSCSRYQGENPESVFSDMLKNVYNFLMSSVTIEKLFDLIQAAENARANVSTGLALINEAISKNELQISTTNLIDRFASTRAIIVYLLTLSGKSATSAPGFQSVLLLIDHIRNLIISGNKEVQTNTLIVFYSNLINAISVHVPDRAFDLLYELVNEISVRKNSLSQKHYHSYMSFIASNLYVFCEKSSQLCGSPSLNRICKAIYESGISQKSSLPIARLFYKLGFNVSIETEYIFNYLIKAPPAEYHAAISLLLELILKETDPTMSIFIVLTTISNICSGSPSLFLEQYPLLLDSQLSKESTIRTPVVLLSGCAELIQMCRLILLSNVENSKKFKNILTYILDHFVPNSTNSHFKPEFEVFSDPKLLFGVFAIFSNVIDTKRNFSLIKDTTSKIIYYVTKIDNIKQQYTAWTIPITGSSSPQSVPFSQSIIQLSMMPFSSNLYSEFQSLIPHFIHHFSSPQITYAGEALSFYVLSSLQEYLSDSTFMRYFIERIGLINIKRITYASNLPMFIRILKSHLVRQSKGFYEPRTPTLQFMYASPADYVPNTYYSIYPNQIFCEDGVHVFMTPPINTHEPTFFYLNITNQPSRILSGLMTLTPGDGSADSLLLSNAKNVSTILSQQTIQLESSITNAVFQFDPNTKIGTIYRGDDLTPIHSMEFQTSQVVLIIFFFSKGSVEYECGESLSTFFQSNSLSSTCTFPLRGSTIFRNKKVKNPIDCSNISNLSIGITTVKGGEIDTSGFSRPLVHMSEKDLDRFAAVTKNQYQELVGYSSSALIKASTSLITADFEKDDFPLPSLQPVDFEALNCQRSSSTYQSSLFSTSDLEAVVDTVIREEDFVAIDDSTGSVHTSRNQFELQENLPQIGPLAYGILPTELLNFFTTGYTSNLRHEVTNHIFLNMIANPSSDLPNIMKLFSLDIKGLLHQFLSLVLYNEKIIPRGMIDYQSNIIDSNSQPHDSSLHLYTTAMHRIIDLIESNNLIATFAEEWFNEVFRRFKDSHYHSVLNGHPSAVVLSPTDVIEPIHVHRPNVTAWFVLKGGLTFDSVPVGTAEGVDKKIFIITNIVNIIRGKTVKFTGNSKGIGSIVAIPFSKFSNESMFGTFIDLAVSFKYLIRYLKINDSKIPIEKMQQWRGGLYSAVYDSIIARSPYFNHYGVSILQYMQSVLPSLSSDLEGRFLQRINFLAVYVSPQRGSYFGEWLNEQQNLWDERVLIPLKAHFREFLTPADQAEISAIKDPKFALPSPPIPFTISEKIDTVKLISRIKRLLTPREQIQGYPFYFLLHFWAKGSIRSPPASFHTMEGEVLHIKFAFHVPKSFRIRYHQSNYDGEYSVSKNAQFSNPKTYSSSDAILSNDSAELFVKLLKQGSTWGNLIYVLDSDDDIQPDQFIYPYKDRFVTDVKMTLTMWNNSLDQAILSCFPSTFYSNSVMKLDIDPIVFNTSKLSGYPAGLLVMRAGILLILNWLLVRNIANFDNDATLKPLLPMIAAPLKLRQFLNIVDQNSEGSRASLSIDRKKASDLREGISTNYSDSFIAQLLKGFSPNSYRVAGDRPWSVSFVNEQGIDVGGPARDLVVECSRDLSSPNSGLVMQTPNSRNQVGGNRDTFIPIPNSQVSDKARLYMIAGTIIGICIRSGLVQEFSFPPLVWDYFAYGTITIEDIYDIDQNYRHLIESLKEAQKSKMDEEAFSKQFNLQFVITNSAGEEVPLIQRGRTEQVTMSNVGRYISLSNEYRLSEMEESLSSMRKGLWINLIKRDAPTFSIDASTIEFAACGDKDISYESLKSITRFEGVAEDQQQIYLRVIERFTPEQRSSLLKFATGRVRLPPASSSNQFMFKVDCQDSSLDKLPTSSTCFHALHIPRYTSFDKAYRMILTASEYSGTFERA